MIAYKNCLLNFFLTLLVALISAHGWGQDKGFTDLQNQFKKFTGQSLQEKIYLHTDKNFYIAGEIIWFKLYCVGEATNHPSDFSKVAYVEILDRLNKPVLQAKIDITKKGGSGSFYLPLTLNSDNYTLRAYTNWMRNIGATSFFKKVISVVNTIKPAEENLQQDPPGVTANFFPEGGNMVQGIETKVAFNIVTADGKGVDVRGLITDDNGDTVQHFAPYKFGIGSFIFKPVAGRNYKATILLPEGKVFTKALPTAYEYGYVMNVTDNRDGRMKVRVQARGKEPGQRGEQVFLLGHTRQVLKVAETGYVNYENDLVLYIDKTKLEQGVSHFTLFNKDQQPVCERLVFTKPTIKDQATINIDKTIYEKRQQVDLSISSVAGSKPIGTTTYSVAVYRLDSLQTRDQHDLVSYLWLTADLKGYVESPGFYFSNDKDVDDATDNLLLTQGWRRFRWENVLSAKSSIQKFIPEYRGHLVTAKITNVINGNPAGDIECFLSFAGSPYGFYAAKTDNMGMVRFDVKNYYGPGEIVIQAGHDTTNNYRVDVFTPFADEYESPELPFGGVLTKKEERLLTGKSIAMQAQNVYVTDSIRQFHQPVLTDTLPFFGKAEYSYRLDDYKRFTTMEEVLREYVLPVNVILRNGKLYMSIYDEITKAVYNDQLLVLLDGVPLLNFNKIFSYDPLKVKRLDVVPTRYNVGGINFKGITSFETYQGKFDAFDLTPGVIAVDYDGLQLQREFYSPVYETAGQREQRIPDFRSTLYWTPDVQIAKDGKAALRFYTSDTPGKFLVVLQGFNGNGEPVSTTSSFIVE